MNEEQMESWDDSTAPKILNSTYYYKRAYIDVNSISVDYGSDYYFILFNENTEDMRLYVNISIIPWGHIIATGVLAMIFLIASGGFVFEMFKSSFFGFGKRDKAKTQEAVNNNHQSEPQSEVGKNFCQSCGAPVSDKNETYCTQCGASITH